MSDEAEDSKIIPSDQTGIWVTPAEAASRLGIAERTLWRRVAKNLIHKRVVRGRAEILIPDGTPTASGDGESKQPIVFVPRASEPPDRAAKPARANESSVALAHGVVQELREQREADAEAISRYVQIIQEQADRIGRLAALEDRSRSQQVEITRLTTLTLEQATRLGNLAALEVQRQSLEETVDRLQATVTEQAERLGRVTALRDAAYADVEKLTELADTSARQTEALTRLERERDQALEEPDRLMAELAQAQRSWSVSDWLRRWF